MNPYVGQSVQFFPTDALCKDGWAFHPGQPLAAILTMPESGNNDDKGRPFWVMAVFDMCSAYHGMTAPFGGDLPEVPEPGVAYSITASK